MRIPDIEGVFLFLWKMTKTPHQSTSEGLPYDVKDKMWVGEVKYIGSSPNFFRQNRRAQNCHLSHPSKAFFALSCAGTYRARILCYYSLHYLLNPPIRFPNRLQTRNWLAWRLVWWLLQSHAVPDFIMARNCTVIF